MADTDKRRRLLAILAADAVGYSRMMAEDDRATVTELDRAREIFRKVIIANAGRVVDTAGDSVLAVFDAVSGAVAAALQVQEALARRAARMPTERVLRFRIGLHLGDVIEKADGTVYGDGVNVAARLQQLASPGSVVVSQSVYAIANGVREIACTFEGIGEHEVKNISDPVKAYECVSLAGKTTRASVVERHRPQRSEQTREENRRRIGALAFAGALVAVVAWISWALITRSDDPGVEFDRRMSFAVLPIEASSSDHQAGSLAREAAGQIGPAILRQFEGAKIVPSAVVEAAFAAQPRDLRRLAAQLDVHFFVRGAVAQVPSGYNLTLALVDGRWGQVLKKESLTTSGPSAGMGRAAFQEAMRSITYASISAEVKGARDKPGASIDFRDLTLQAFLDWHDMPQTDGYARAKSKLDRAFLMNCCDLFALRLRAEMNTCDCLWVWRKNTVDTDGLADAAIETYLSQRPNTSSVMTLRAKALLKQGRYEDVLRVSDSVLAREPEFTAALWLRATALAKLKRLNEASALSQQLARLDDSLPIVATVAAIQFAVGADGEAAALANSATRRMTSQQLADPSLGRAALTLVAAESRLGRSGRAREALERFSAAVPSVKTVGDAKRWLLSDTVEADSSTLFEQLVAAGLPL